VLNCAEPLSDYGLNHALSLGLRTLVSSPEVLHAVQNAGSAADGQSDDYGDDYSSPDRHSQDAQPIKEVKKVPTL